jgi:hypothetical protein
LEFYSPQTPSATLEAFTDRSIVMGLCYNRLWLQAAVEATLRACAAARRGIRIDWQRHARVGVPVTLATLAICAASLWWRVLPAA